MRARHWPLLFASLTLGACATTTPRGPTPAPPTQWQAEHFIDHPLIGRIWSVREGRFATPDEVLAAAQKAKWVLLGERHDNPDHHRLQAWLLARLLQTRPGLAVGFEMLDDDDAAPLAALTSREPEAVAEAVKWADSGWPDFAMYAPVFAEAALAAAPLLATHPTKATVRVVMADGLSALPKERLEALRVAPELAGKLLADLQAEVKASHCGHAPESMLTAMVAAQQLKDAWMAQRLVEQAPAQGAVLLAGGVHTRRDRGVPRYLARHEAGRGAVALIDFAEVHPTGPRVTDYLDEGDDAYDFIWFTPAANDDDPCERYREMLERMRDNHGKAKPAAP